MKKPFYLKHIAFVGNFKDGSLPLKDIVFQADGAPVENIAVFTHYLVIGDRGKSSKLYEKWSDQINAGYLIPLTPDELKDIAYGKKPAPECNRDCAPGTIVLETENSRQIDAENEISLWRNKRDAFITRYGVSQLDGSRLKVNMKAARVLGDFKGY